MAGEDLTWGKILHWFAFSVRFGVGVVYKQRSEGEFTVNEFEEVI